MAIQGQRLSAVEHDWYATRSGLPNTAPLGDHKVTYYGTKGFGANMSIAKPLSQIEGEWLNNVGGATCGGPYEAWTMACAAQSVPVGSTVDACKFNFYTGVASGTNP
jgi:hypothetical protein